MDAINFGAWEGRTTTASGGVGEALAAQVHATLGSGASPASTSGDALPPLWHWCAFPTSVSTAELGADGHPHLGDFLPPIRLNRRMWAGGSLEFLAPAAIGDPLTLRSTILRIDEKQNDHQPMVFVTVEHEIRAPRGIAVRERQTIVYLDIPEEFAPPRRRPMPDNPSDHCVFDVSEITLFRFSAMTFNAHRIHYDLDYARRVERYPALVIHGPLQAMKLMQLAQENVGGVPSHFEFRGVHPMFLGAPLDLMASEDEDGGLALFAGQSGHQGTVAKAFWEGTV